jgi:hypothetical protein
VNWPAALLVVAGYLLGSLSFALLLVRWRTGTDIRTEGSGNAGATNVLRAHGKALGVAVALLDVAKGSAAVLLVRLVTADPRYAAAAGFAAILGHVFPLYSGFRGGKESRPRWRLSRSRAAWNPRLPGRLCRGRGRHALRLARLRRVDGASAPAAGLLSRAPRAVVVAAAATASSSSSSTSTT